MSRITVGFVGQCHISGYDGVPSEAAFPEVCRRDLQSARPGHRVELVLEPYYHPGELERVVDRVLRHRPRVVVVEVVGWLAIAGSSTLDFSRLPRGIRTAVDRARHFGRVMRQVTKKTQSSGLIHHVQTNTLEAASGLLRPLLPRLPRPTLADYEHGVDAALKRIAAAGSVAVVQGPGAPTFAGECAVRLPEDTLQRYRAVHDLSRRAADTNRALYVDRWDAFGPGIYHYGSPRPTLKGHSILGHVLAEHLLRAGIV